MTTGGVGALQMMTGDLGGAWMMTEFLDEMRTEAPGVVQMRIDSQDVMTTGVHGVVGMMTEGPGVVMIQDLVLGDHLVNQADGENERKLAKTAGDPRETPDLRKTVSWIEIKILMKMKRIVSLTKIVTLIGMIASDVQGMRLAGEEDQLRKFPAGEIQVVETNGIEVVVT